MIPPPVLRPQIFLAAAVTAAALTAGCTHPAPPDSRPEKTHLTVGILPITDTAPFFIALQDGYFTRQGLDVTYTTVTQSTAAIPALLHGSVDLVGGANYVSWFKATAAGLGPWRILADGADCAPHTHAIEVLPKSGITSPPQLAGKTIAVNILNDVQTMTADEQLSAYGIKPRQVHYVVIPFASMAAALAAGRVQAAYLVEPFKTETETSLSGEPLVDACTAGDANLPLAGYITTQAWAHRYPRTAAAIARAIEQANARADDDRMAVQQALMDYQHLSQATAAVITLDHFPTGPPNTVQIQRVADHMRTAGLLKHPLDVAPMTR